MEFSELGPSHVTKHAASYPVGCCRTVMSAVLVRKNSKGSMHWLDLGDIGYVYIFYGHYHSLGS